MTRRLERRFGVATAAASAIVLMLAGISAPAMAADAVNTSCTSLTLAQVQSRILTDVNSARAANGRSPLAANSFMDAVATAWSAQQASAATMSHNPDYSTQIPAGWMSAAENVAYGQSATAVTTAWMNSSGHRANILNTGFTHIGVGVGCSAKGVPYYTQVFGSYSRTPGTAAAPVSLKVAPGPGSATVSWSSLPYVDDQTLTAFTITSNPGGVTATTSGAARSTVVTGLTPGVSYTFTATSTNKYGLSPVSAASVAVVPTAAATSAPTPSATTTPTPTPTATPTATPTPTPTPTATPTVDPAAGFTVQAHVQSLGWIKGGGTTGKGLRLEALRITQTQSTQTICLRAHVANIGWMTTQCTTGKGTTITAGTTGRGLPLEALEIWTPGARIWARGHVQNIGWQPVQTATKTGGHITIGTTGRSLAIEQAQLWP